MKNDRHLIFKKNLNKLRSISVCTQCNVIVITVVYSSYSHQSLKSITPKVFIHKFIITMACSVPFIVLFILKEALYWKLMFNVKISKSNKQFVYDFFALLQFVSIILCVSHILFSPRSTKIQVIRVNLPCCKVSHFPFC